MGRILLFGTQACPHCKRAKAALNNRRIPFVEVDVQEYPERRKEMSGLAHRVSIPQVFFNDHHVGGADDLVQLLDEWDLKYPYKTSLEIYEEQVASKPNSSDPRLAVPRPSAQPDHCSEPEQPSSASLASSQVQLPGPDDSTIPILDLVEKLDRLLDRQSRPYKAHWYKNCFINTEALDVLRKEFPGTSAAQLIQWMRQLQTEYGFIHHVCDDHLFREDGYFFFRLQKYHQPQVLNSFVVWNKVVKNQQSINPASNAMTLIKQLHRQLHKIIGKHVSDDGLTDYTNVQKDPDFAEFEFAVCELQALNLGELDETTRKAFGINLYNLFILYAFAKVGIATSNMSRHTFFSSVQMNIGGHLFSFNDLENGILRANTRHPYAVNPPFVSESDPRLPWALSKLDCRLHFSLNCGAKSCPPIKLFNPKSLEEELDIVSKAFCETDDAVLVKEDSHEVHLSMIFKWFQADFCDSKDQLPKVVSRFLTGPKQEALLRMLHRQESGEKKQITIRFQSYNWSANASNFATYNQSNLKANEYSATAMLHFQGHFDCMQIPRTASVTG